jgi:hypothetical protein
VSETQAPKDGTTDEVEVSRVIDPATVRRAPRYKAFFWTGALVGIVAGVALSLYLVGTREAEGILKPGVYATVLTAFVTTVTTLLAGFAAVVADRWSLRRR